MSMFEPSRRPRVFALPPGCGFAEEFTQGLIDRFSGSSPETMARSEIYLNTGRVRRGVTAAFAARGAFLLPKLRLITELSSDVRFFDIAPPVSALRRRLELFQAVSKLLEKDDRFAARPSAFDLADSLAALMDEMHAEGVSPGSIGCLDVSQHSAHWARSLRFLDIIGQFWGRTDAPDRQARQRMAVEALVDSWRREPPRRPVIIAGSTGSRGATNLLMQAAARLPQGAVVLPCFDRYLPEDSWDRMGESASGEDHPQFRLKSFFDNLNMRPSDVLPWREGAETAPERNRLLSLALRPAPVTGQWLAEGPQMKGIEAATENMSLLEAPHPRAEAVAIAFRLRQAAESGETAALVTPDRKLAKQVRAALVRWRIEPEDSFEVTLAETAPGRLLLLVAGLLGNNPDPVPLIGLLRHPMVHSGSRRRSHCRQVDRLEHDLRRNGMSRDFGSRLRSLFPEQETYGYPAEWRVWLMEILEELASAGEACLTEIASAHLRIAEKLASGPDSGAEGPDGVWDVFAGPTALELMRELRREGASGGILDTHAYRHLFASLARLRSVPRAGGKDFPGISIWNTLDARMQAPDLVIAGGLNEGVWPAAVPVDPWLNRDLRRQAGLLMPERLTGLLAHDFQQAAAARVVVLSRSERRGDEPAVPSRWLIRLTTLLAGIGDHGESALEAMRERGNRLLEISQEMERPEALKARETRPCPKPPVSARPKSLAVTAVKTLISNPYEIYARHVLKLRELDPLQPDAFAAARGTAVHEILHRFVDRIRTDHSQCTAENLLAAASGILDPLPVAAHIKRLWLAQLAGTAEEFIEQELRRAECGSPAALEMRGEHQIAGTDFTLTARADRVDKLREGGLALFDYKTGTIPGRAEISRRDKQMPLTAKMLELGGFPDIPKDRVRKAAYIGIGKSAAVNEIECGSFDETWRNFTDLVKSYEDPRTGYLSRLNMHQFRFGRVFDHLARYGEWDESTNPQEPPPDE